ncbi:regulator of volume decrease after cellular swelling-domain-containing protein [Infundibulicybe gibba]|nr:regulator of volume decrease after cellular swelling-domain-containing protein [Infundibulicybe gibba]
MPAVTLITAVPTHVSTEEHRLIVAQTPASFGDIPPILRHKQSAVRVELDPPSTASTQPTPRRAPSTSSQGSLPIPHNCVLNFHSVLAYVSDAGVGFQIAYPTITLHAVSRAGDAPAIYCQLDEQAPDAPTADDTDAPMRELTIVPQDPSSLDPIFEALSQCASLHPDHAFEDDADEDDDAFIDSGAFDVFDGDAQQELSAAGRAALAHLESIIYDPADDRGEEGEEEAFEDAEEDGVEKAGKKEENPTIEETGDKK